MPKRTSASPGSPEKIAVMRLRLERGEHLFHPKDPRIEWEYAIMSTVSRTHVSMKELREALYEHNRQIRDDD